MIQLIFILGAFPSKNSASDSCDSYTKNVNQNCVEDDKNHKDEKNNWALIPYSADSVNSHNNILPLFSARHRRVKIDDLEFTFDQDWDGAGVAGVIWDASLTLAEYVLKISLEGKFVLELGSGASAIPSLVSARKGAKVTATDLPKNLAILKKNVRRNRSITDQINVKPLDWTKKDQYFTPPIQNFDLILGADVIYDESLFDHLIQIFKFYASDALKTEILLAIRFRYECERTFLNLVNKSGFEVAEKFYDTIRDIYIYSIKRNDSET